MPSLSNIISPFRVRVAEIDPSFIGLLKFPPMLKLAKSIVLEGSTAIKSAGAVSVRVLEAASIVVIPL